MDKFDIPEIVTVAFARKARNRDEWLKYKGSPVRAAVYREVEFTVEEFDELIDNLTSDRDWITKEDGGDYQLEEDVIIGRVIKVTDGKRTIYIDSQGYGYPRYVAFVE